MRDLLFFPVSALLAAAFVLVALEPYRERLPSGPVSGGGRNAQDLTVAGEELNRFIVGEMRGASLNLMRPEGGQAFLVSTAKRTRLMRIRASARTSRWRKTSSTLWNRAPSRL
jgi:hypothetical protein